MPVKTKENYKTEEDESNSRDNFYTPRYATELLVPFIPKRIKNIWECANGEGSISNVLSETKRYSVLGSDLRDPFQTNFLTDTYNINMFKIKEGNSWAIITNPPFGIKKKFYERCVEIGIPFALLIPADYSGWIIEAVDKYGCEKIIPTRRINYITPFICDLVYRKELKLLVEKETGKKFGDVPADIINSYRDQVEKYGNWKDIPQELIAKHSSSDFHSLWLTWGFGLGKSETFVDLPIDWIKNRIF